MTPSQRNKWIWLTVAALAGSLSAEGAEIQLRPTATVRGSLVLLGDVADVQAGDERQVDALRRIELFPSPAQGRSRVAQLAEIRQLLLLHGIEPNQHRLTGAESVRIAYDRVDPKTDPRTGPQIGPSVESKSLVEIVVAKRPISAGSIVRASDIEMQPSGAPVNESAVAMDAELVIGQLAQRKVAAGQPIDPRSLRKPILVRRGEVVSVVAKSEGVRVRTTAKALADAAAGELLLVESLDNREKYSAVVTGLREAVVLATGTTVSDSPSASISRLGARR